MPSALAQQRQEYRKQVQGSDYTESAMMKQAYQNAPTTIQSNFSSGNTPNAVANNQYNQLQKTQAEQRKLAESSNQEGFSIFQQSTNNNFNIQPQSQWEFKYNQDAIGAIDSSIRSRQREQAQLAIDSTLQKQGLIERTQEEKLSQQQEADAIMFGGREGAITNSGLLNLHKQIGDRGLDALRADNRITLSDMKMKALQMVNESDKEYRNNLEKYITVEQSKMLVEFNDMVSTGAIASIDDKSLLAIAREAGVSEIKALSLKGAVQQNIAGSSGKDLIEKEINSQFRSVSPTGWIFKENKAGGSLDSNGTYRFAEPKDGRKQCGEYVNDALGYSSAGGGAGDTPQSKLNMISSFEPIQYGAFIQGSGQYGHIGIVEKTYTKDGEQYIEIAESNYDNKEGFRRQTLKLVGGDKSGATEWQPIGGGKTRRIDGFAQNKLSKDIQEEVADPIIQRNFEVANNYSKPFDFQEIKLNVVSEAKNRFGMKDDAIMALSNQASKYGGFQNAMLIDYFNQNKMQLPQSLLDSSPVDKVEMIKTASALYGTEVPPETYKSLVQAGRLDAELGAAMANAQIQKDTLSQQRQDFANQVKEAQLAISQEKQNTANLKVAADIEKANQDIAIKQAKLDQQIAAFEAKQARTVVTKQIDELGNEITTTKPISVDSKNISVDGVSGIKPEFQTDYQDIVIAYGKIMNSTKDGKIVRPSDGSLDEALTLLGVSAGESLDKAIFNRNQSIEAMRN